jgi:hypothetical protein
MQFRNGAANIIDERLPFPAVSIRLVLHVAGAQSAPEVRELLADLRRVNGNPSDDFRE